MLGIISELTFRPVVVDVYGDVAGRVDGAEDELLRLAGHQDEPQVYLEIENNKI